VQDADEPVGQLPQRGLVAGFTRVRGQLRPGDLLIYRTDGPSRRHVAIVVGPGRMVEARALSTM
jgi:cell wall-associated NlpC family hydrolase